MSDALLVLLGSIGWGLLACGAITHVWHHRRLRGLLAMHLDHERVPAALLTLVEVVLVVGIAASIRGGSQAIMVGLAIAATLLALVFVFWIGRLLVTGSELPCACSFSDAPTTWWSFARAVGVALVASFTFVNLSDYGSATTTANTAATVAVGWAVGAAIFVLPEAISWPTASKALMARVDAHTADLP